MLGLYTKTFNPAWGIQFQHLPTKVFPVGGSTVHERLDYFKFIYHSHLYSHSLRLTCLSRPSCWAARAPAPLPTSPTSPERPSIRNRHDTLRQCFDLNNTLIVLLWYFISVQNSFLALVLRCCFFTLISEGAMPRGLSQSNFSKFLK